MYITYILYSANQDRYYIGFTGDDIQQRLRRHNTHHKGFTGTANDWIVVYTESYQLKKVHTKESVSLRVGKAEPALKL